MHRVKLHIENIKIGPLYKRHTLSGDNSGRVRNETLKQIAAIEEEIGKVNRRNIVIPVPAASVSVFEFEVR